MSRSQRTVPDSGSSASRRSPPGATTCSSPPASTGVMPSSVCVAVPPAVADQSILPSSRVQPGGLDPGRRAVQRRRPRTRRPASCSPRPRRAGTRSRGGSRCSARGAPGAEPAAVAVRHRLRTTTIPAVTSTAERRARGHPPRALAGARPGAGGPRLGGEPAARVLAGGPAAAAPVCRPGCRTRPRARSRAARSSARTASAVPPDPSPGSAGTAARDPPAPPPESGSLCTTWYATMYGLSESKGPRPVAACTSTAPIANTSAAGPTSRGRWNCSGAMNGGVPISLPVSVRRSLSAGREIPKSMTLGPSGASSTLLGLRSRCTTPARWMSRSASASPAPSLAQLAGAQRPVPLHPLGERRALDEQRGHPGPFGLRVGIDDGRGEGPADPPGGRDLLPETGSELRVRRHARHG